VIFEVFFNWFSVEGVTTPTFVVQASGPAPFPVDAHEEGVSWFTARALIFGVLRHKVEGWTVFLPPVIFDNVRQNNR